MKKAQASSVITEKKVSKWAQFIKLPKKIGYKIGKKPKTAPLRKSLSPGTIVIILSGRFRGKRAVFLKQLPSGLLLITGPYSVNGVPLRRVNQRYVIATSTKVDVADVDTNKFTDEYFAKPKVRRGKDDASIFVNQGEKKEKPRVEEARKADQTNTDAALAASISKDGMLSQYLKTRFTLRNNTFPHRMKF